jgi:hypothetical protein
MLENGYKMDGEKFSCITSAHGRAFEGLALCKLYWKKVQRNGRQLWRPRQKLRFLLWKFGLTSIQFTSLGCKQGAFMSFLRKIFSIPSSHTLTVPASASSSLQFLFTRLEIISDVVSERHVAEKFRYHIGNTDTTSVFSDTTSEVLGTSVFPMWYRKKPMWYRYFRCGIGIFPLRAFSDTTSEIISNRVKTPRVSNKKSLVVLQLLH